MSYIENQDYRFDHEKKVIYVSKRLHNEAYRPNSDFQRLTSKWWEKGYQVKHDCSDTFIRTGVYQHSPF